MKTTLLSIMRSQWALHPEWVAANLQLIEGLMRGDGNGLDSGERYEGTDCRLMYGQLYNVGYNSDISKLPQGSTVTVDIIGPIMKYGGMCSYGSMELADLTERLSRAENISTIIYNIDSPGGQCAGTSTFGDAIKASSKRTIAFIHDGYAASAGYWLACCCDEIYVSHATDQVGSVGVLCTIADYIGQAEKQGLKMIEVYAPQSTDKNGDVKAALAGKPEALQQNLGVLAGAFITTVKNNRGDRLTSEEWTTGKMFYAPDALRIGLIDGQKNLAEIMEMVDAGIMPTSTGGNNSATQNSEITMFGNKLKKTYGLRNKAAGDISAEDLLAANEELHANGIDKNLTLGNSGANMATAEELASANEALEEATAALDTSNASLTTSQARVAQLEKELATQKNKTPGASFIKPATAKVDADATEDADQSAEEDDFEHNRKADALTSWK